MEIYLDSSKVKEAEKWFDVIDGATTNPTILKKDGGDIFEFCECMAPKPVSVEATGDLLTEAREYASRIKNAVIKVTLLDAEDGNNIRVIRQLQSEGISVNCTALFSLSQFILAAATGARYLSLFVGRIEDEGHDTFSVMAACAAYLERLNTGQDLIIGSIRTVGHVCQAAMAGADIATVPPAVLEKMIEHKFSRETVRMFERDAQSLKGAVT